MAAMNVRKIIPNWVVNNLKHLPVGIAANVRYGFPSKGMVVIGVTGTDGKTTTVNMIYEILKKAGKNAAMVSTVKAVIGDREIDTGFHVTSPTHFDMQKYIRMAKTAGCRYLVLEVSSFALAQYRVWGIRFDIGVITNVTREHLDYHKSWENYFLAKSKLVKTSRLAVINRDEKHYSRLEKMATGKVVSFGKSAKADFNPKKFPLKLKVLGEFNVMNAEAAAAATVNLGIDRDTIRKALVDFEPVKGRMNIVKNNRGLDIFVDYAHTPNGLENALMALRSKNGKGRLIAVIGAEGERDESKRRPMGEIAARLADYVVVTAVDPRGKLGEISAEILKGALAGGKKNGLDVFVIDDRKEAIKKAVIDLAKKGDIVGIFGKGHEKSMNIDGKHEIAWSDFGSLAEILKSNG